GRLLRTACHGSSNRGKRVLQIVDEISNVLDAHREADQAVGDAERLSRLLGDGSVRHDRGVLDEALHAAQGFRQGEDLHPAEELVRRLESAVDLEGEHPAEAALLPPGELVLGMRFEPRPGYLADLRMRGEEIR